MSRVEVYRNNRLGGCAWLITIPALVIGLVMCGIAAVSIGFAGDFVGPEAVVDPNDWTQDGRSLGGL